MSNLFVHSFNVQQFYRILSGTTTPGQSGSGSIGNEGVLHIPQSSKIGASPSDGFVSYPGHWLGWGSYPSAEMQFVYSTAPANRAYLSLRKYTRTHTKK